jgi:hypothetical protein
VGAFHQSYQSVSRRVLGMLCGIFIDVVDFDDDAFGSRESFGKLQSDETFLLEGTKVRDEVIHVVVEPFMELESWRIWVVEVKLRKEPGRLVSNTKFQNGNHVLIFDLPGFTRFRILV